MKYIKRFMPLVLLLVLLVACLVFPASASAAEPGGDDGIVQLNFGDTVYEIDVYDCSNWSDVIANRTQSCGTLSTTSGGVVCFTPKNSDITFIVLDYRDNNEIASKVISWENYYLSAVVEFTFEEVNDEMFPSGVKYSFSKEIFTGFTLRQLIFHKVCFSNPTLGDCYFIYDNDTGFVLFAVGKKNDGTFAERYILLKQYNSSDYLTYDDPEMTLISGDYFAMDACLKNVHSWGSLKKESDPTCTEAGVSSAVCKYCGEKKYEYAAELGHERFLGVANCARCGTNIWNDIGNALQNGANVVGGAIQEGLDSLTGGNEDKEESLSLWDKLTAGFDDLKEDMNSFVTTVVVILGACIFLALMPVLIPFFKWVWKGVVFTWNSLKDLFKSIGNSASKSSRSRKGKGKKRTKK